MRRARAQSLVEFAVAAPIIILLTMVAWDGGSVLREQVVLQQAARDGARVAAASYAPGASLSIVQDAVLASAGDLPSLATSPGYLSVNYPDPQSIQVQLRYTHALITPVLRQLWGGGQGSVVLSASATFYLPQQTPVPATIVPSTPIPTSTPSPTVTPTPTFSPTATPTPTGSPTPTPLNVPCSLDPTPIAIPQLNTRFGYWCTLQIAASSWIIAAWQDNADPTKQLLVYPNNPFAGPTDPVPTSPLGGSVSTSYAYQSQQWAATNGCQPAGTYSVYFWNSGSQFASSTGYTWVVPGCSGPPPQP